MQGALNHSIFTRRLLPRLPDAALSMRLHRSCKPTMSTNYKAPTTIEATTALREMLVALESDDSERYWRTFQTLDAMHNSLRQNGNALGTCPTCGCFGFGESVRIKHDVTQQECPNDDHCSKCGAYHDLTKACVLPPLSSYGMSHPAFGDIRLPFREHRGESPE